MKYSFSACWRTLKNYVSTSPFCWGLAVGLVISAIILTLTGLWSFFKMVWIHKFLSKLILLAIVTTLIESIVLYSYEEFDRLQSERPESIRCRFHRLEYKRPQFSAVCERIVITLLVSSFVGAALISPDVILSMETDFLPHWVKLNELLSRYLTAPYEFVLPFFGKCLIVFYEFVLPFINDAYLYRFRLVSLSCLVRTCDLVYRKRHKHWEGYCPQFNKLIAIWVLQIFILDFLIPFFSG